MLNRGERSLPLLFKCGLSLFLAFILSTKLHSTKQAFLEANSTGQVHTFTLEVADTGAKREKGLMYRKSLKDNEGMLFVFSEPERLCFWMKNTFIPLDIILLDKQGVIVEILEDMRPHSQKQRCSKGFIQRAIELKAGICHDKGISVGDVLTFVTTKQLE